jgi:tetratricopeptide (TPR) repeat protein
MKFFIRSTFLTCVFIIVLLSGCIPTTASITPISNSTQTMPPTWTSEPTANELAGFTPAISTLPTLPAVNNETPALNPENANVYYQSAKSNYESAAPKGSLETYISQLNQALADIDTAIFLNPNVGDFYSLRQSIYFSLSGTVEYQVDSQYLITMALDNAYKAYELGTTTQYPERIIIVDLIGTNQCQKAQDEVQKLINQSPAGDISLGGLLHIRSQAYACLGRLDEAIQSVNYSMFNNVNMEHKYNLKVQYLLMLGKYEEALPILDKRIQETNLSGWLYYMRAEAYYNLGKKDLVQKELNEGMFRTWGQGGWLAYVEAQIALDDNRKEDAIRFFQYADATFDPTYNPLRWKIQEQLELLGAQPLALTPSIHYQATPIP